MFGAWKRRADALEEELRKVKNQMADRDLAWEEMRARCKRLLDRTEKQYRALETEPPAAEIPTPQLPTGATVIQPTGDRMNRIREQLAARGRRSA